MARVRIVTQRSTVSWLPVSAMLVLPVAACGVEESASPRRTDFLRAQPALDAVGRYTALSADVNVQTEISKGAATRLVAGPGSRRYRVEATRGSDGFWQTKLLLPPRQLPFPVGKAAAPEYDVARIEFESSTNRPRIFTRTGTELTIPEPASPGTIRSRLRSGATTAIPNVVHGTGPKPSDWIRGFLVATDRGAAVSAALTGQFGAPSRGGDGNDVFTKSARDTTVEVVFDSQVGQVGAVTVTVGGRVVARVAHGFSEVAPGAIGRTSTESVFTQRDGAVITTRVRYENVVLVPAQ